MTLLLALPGGQALAQRLASLHGIEWAVAEVHRFPDGEQLVRVDAPVAQQTVVLVAGLERPDDKVLPLLFAADLVRELGATRVGLVAPYLPYMRQDTRFRPGEAITSASFAALLSARLDFLVTVEPHLHRWHDLGELYGMPARAVSAAPPIAAWLRGQVAVPLLVGPDEESEQWVARIAAELGAPYTVLRKARLGDFDVRIDAPLAASQEGREAVLVDDIVSTGQTLLAGVQALRQAGWPARLCVCVHALFDDAAQARFAAADLRVASCASVPHPSNAIDLTAAIAAALAPL